MYSSKRDFWTNTKLGSYISHWLEVVKDKCELYQLGRKSKLFNPSKLVSITFPSSIFNQY